MQRKLAKCRSCGAAIFWIKTPSGRNAPIDAQQTSGTTVWVYEPPNWKLSGGKGFVSHFATCPNAEQHRTNRQDGDGDGDGDGGEQ